MSPADDFVQPSQGAVVRGRYALEHLIARGGMGAVWRAADLVLERPVAVKFMDPRSAESADWRARFEREAKAAARLRTPHVVQVFDHGVESGAPFIVMELLEGEDLGRRLRRLRRLGLRATATVVSQAARALRLAHDEGILHRDLKPQNVFLARSDDEEVVKLLDFGVAKILAGRASASLGGATITPPSGSVVRSRGSRAPGEAKHAVREDGALAEAERTNRTPPPPHGMTHEDDEPAHSESEVTRTGELLGSPQYMSPEQARGLRDIDARSDLWSLSVIAYRALTGRQPFVGQGVGDVIYRICSEPIAPPSTLAPELPPEIDAFFERALARDPAQRFQSAAELAAAFARAASEPVPASLPPPAAEPRSDRAEPWPSDPAPATPSFAPTPAHPSPSAQAAMTTPLQPSEAPTGAPSAVTFPPAAQTSPPPPATRRLLAAAIGAFCAIVVIGLLGLRWRSTPAPSNASAAAAAESAATLAPPPSAPAARVSAEPSAAAPVPSQETAQGDRPAVAGDTPAASATAASAPPAPASARPPGPAKKKTDWGY